MKTPLLIASSFLIAATAVADVPVVHSPKAEVEVGMLAQVLGLAQHLDDPAQDDDRFFLFLDKARLRTSGRYEDLRFRLELGLGGEESLATKSGVSLSLLDLSVDIPLRFLEGGSLRAGQFKVPYGREALTYSGDSQFISRSIDHLGFRVGRDVGVALTLRPGPLTAVVGVFTGGGRDIPPQHYLPERLGVPLFATRVGVGNLIEDPYALQAVPATRALQGAISVNALYTRDSVVGHSTVLNVKLADKSLLLNENWNPYIGKRPLSQGDWWQVGADAAVRGAAGPLLLSGEVELNWAGYANDAGVLHVGGVRAQGAADYGKAEVALRYALLVPDAHFANGGVPITGGAAIHELTPSLAYRFAGDRLKLVADLPLLLQVPVFLEPNVGAYVGTELPDESALLASGGSVERQNVIEARLMLQASF